MTTIQPIPTHPKHSLRKCVYFHTFPDSVNSKTYNSLLPIPILLNTNTLRIKKAVYIDMGIGNSRSNQGRAKVLAGRSDKEIGVLGGIWRIGRVVMGVELNGGFRL